MTVRAPSPIQVPFDLNGTLVPLLKGARGPLGHTPTRPLGGWLMVYALIGANGGLVPVRDRDGQFMEAASELGRVDWSEYMRKGHWNDTHDESVLVGHSTALEFHDASTELAKAHGKVGFWTAGHLWDRNDPQSWTAYTDHRPNERDLAQADYFWEVAQCLKGSPRPLGFSAHGWMYLSPCKSRVLSAVCQQAAVCESPKNPGSTAEPMELGEGWGWMRKGLITRHDRPCRTCTCPPGAACLPMRSGVGDHDVRSLSAGRAKEVEQPLDELAPDERLEALIALICERYFVGRADALRWINNYLGRADGAEEGRGREAPRAR